MNATRTHINSGNADEFLCGACGKVWLWKDVAERCCSPRNCEDCGIALSSGTATVCNVCSNTRQRVQLEALRFRDAEKITAWDGPVWTSETDHNNGYFASIEALVEHYEDLIAGDEADEVESPPSHSIPKYAWICELEPVVDLSFDTIADNILEEAPDEYDISSLRGVAEFKAAIAAFNAANTHLKQYGSTTNKVILLGD